MKRIVAILILLFSFLSWNCSTSQQPNRSHSEHTSQNERGIKVTKQISPFSELRTALVIGNSAYNYSPLRNPINDARAMAKTLRKLGFDVTKGENLCQKEMKIHIDYFGKKISTGGICLFYYAGHGMQVKGHNYLIPIDAKIESEEEVEYEAVDAGRVLAKMFNANTRLNIVILDACRDNPLARSFRSATKGLAHMDAPSGTIVAYATAPGSVANDGPGQNWLYTQSLIKNMSVPGLKIEDMFKRVRSSVREQTYGKQISWESSSLEGDFYFKLPDEKKIKYIEQYENITLRGEKEFGIFIPNHLIFEQILNDRGFGDMPWGTPLASILKKNKLIISDYSAFTEIYEDLTQLFPINTIYQIEKKTYPIQIPW